MGAGLELPEDAAPGALSSADTIAAAATPPGQGGIGIVRISGPLAFAIGEAMVGDRPAPRQAAFRRFVRLDEPLDQGLALFFPGPGSFTGEDVVELQGHGGPLVLQRVLDAVLAQGARLARPGEFTERAFLNGRLDLAQAEAVADLIASASAAAARSAARSLSGAFSAAVKELDVRILELRVGVEAAIDFPDEEVEFLERGQVSGRVEELRAAVGQLLEDGRQGVLLSSGVKVALLGAPNVGKSSLLNRLSGEQSAIVTHVPGTTRDLLKVDLTLDGLPLRLVDTAGLRPTEDPVEVEGVRRAQAEAESADLVVLVRDAAGESEDAPRIGRKRTLLVDNKIDLTGAPPGLDRSRNPPRVRISCRTGAGLGALRDAIKERVGFFGGDSKFSARRRHLAALEAAGAALAAAGRRLQEQAPGELIAEELRLAHLALGEITGETAPDELLGQIFSAFCIGK